MTSRIKEIAREYLSPLMRELQDSLNKAEWVRAMQVIEALNNCLAVLIEETNLLEVDKEMTKVLQSFPCGCYISLMPDRSYSLEYCLKHKAAPKMYEALKKIKAEGTYCLDIIQSDLPLLSSYSRQLREIYDINKVDRIARFALEEIEKGG